MYIYIKLYYTYINNTESIEKYITLTERATIEFNSHPNTVLPCLWDESYMPSLYIHLILFSNSAIGIAIEGLTIKNKEKRS